MSPPSSAQASTTSSSRPATKTSHSRHTSTTAPLPSQETRPSKASSPRPPPSPRQVATTSKAKVKYTCYIRLPFARGEFLDPPPVEWDAGKDRLLWKVVSKTSNSKDLDWEDIAARFEVDLPFLLQQAAWLYERHLEGMRKQMQKLGQSHALPPNSPLESSGTSTVPATGGVAMQRQSSREAAAARMPSVINTLKSQGTTGTGGSGSLGSDGSSPGTPRSAHPGISRTPSTTTVTQSKILAGSSRQPHTFQRAPRTSSGSQRQPPKLVYASKTAQGGESDEALTSESDSEDEPPRTASQAFKRAPLGKKPMALRRVSSDGDREGEDDDEDDDEDGGYLPFAAASKATTRGEPAIANKERPAAGVAGPSATRTATASTRQPPPPPPDSSATSSTTSSAAQPPASTSSDSQTLPQTRPPGPLSPRHRAQIANANFSPTSRSSGRGGSEGSPSMGSSFSDLDGDASVTQSALEEALLSGVQKGNLSLIGRAVGRRG